MIREFVFHENEGQSLRAYIKQVFATSKFLHYGISEKELVECVVMNFHPCALSHAKFDRPRTLKELYQVVGIGKEKFAVVQERLRPEAPSTDIHNSRGVTRSVPARTAYLLKCWNCGSWPIGRVCPRTAHSPGNGQAPGGL
jgi:hypothetical protein